MTQRVVDRIVTLVGCGCYSPPHILKDSCIIKHIVTLRSHKHFTLHKRASHSFSVYIKCCCHICRCVVSGRQLPLVAERLSDAFKVCNMQHLCEAERGTPCRQKHRTAASQLQLGNGSWQCRCLQPRFKGRERERGWSSNPTTLESLWARLETGRRRTPSATKMIVGNLAGCNCRCHVKSKCRLSEAQNRVRELIA